MNIKSITKNKQFKGIISLGIGTIMAQLITVIIQPILTRLLSPEELGTYTFIISMATLVIPIASLKLEMLIVVEKDDEEAETITDASIISLILISIIATLVILSMLLVGNNPISMIGTYALLIPLIILTNGLRFIFVSYNNRQKKYKLIAKISVLREVIMGAIQMISALISGGILGQVLGYAVAPLYGIKEQSKDYIYIKKNRKKTTIKKILSIFKVHKKHILCLVPAQFINSFSYTLIMLSIVSLFSTEEVGYYSISVRVLGLPLVLISNNVSKIYMQKLAEDHSKGNSVWHTFKTTILILGGISVLGFGCLAFIAPTACEIIFGHGYVEAGKYISILCIIYALRFISSALIGTYVVFNKQNWEFFFQSCLVIVGVVVYLIVLILKLDIYEYFILISLGYALIYSAIIYSFMNLCKKK